MRAVGDWYRTHSASPDCYPEDEYRGWAQDAGARVDAVGNVIWPDQEPAPLPVFPDGFDLVEDGGAE